jgi:predicted Zn-dependent protease
MRNSRLISTLSPRCFYLIARNQVLVHLIVIDTPEAESFTVAPERIYIPRKMLALLRNDDKLAGWLLGHELFREILGVNVVSDRKDMSDKLIRSSTAMRSWRAKLLKSSTGRKRSRIRQIAWRCRSRQRLAIRRKRMRNFLTVRWEQMEAVAVF